MWKTTGNPQKSYRSPTLKGVSADLPLTLRSPTAHTPLGTTYLPRRRRPPASAVSRCDSFDVVAVRPC